MCPWWFGHAAGPSNVEDQQLFIAVANRFSSHNVVASLPPWDLCALSLGMTR